MTTPNDHPPYCRNCGAVATLAIRSGLEWHPVCAECASWWGKHRHGPLANVAAGYGDQLECLEHGPACAGPVEYRMPLSGTGRAFPRCEAHWDRRLDEQARINRTYPATAPSDFDPAYAGECWDEP